MPYINARGTENEVENGWLLGYASVTWSHPMSGIASNAFELPRYVNRQLPRPRSEAKRSRIVDTAMQHFAENGYHAARVGDMAAGLGIAKGWSFQIFGRKNSLFFVAYT